MANRFSNNKAGLSLKISNMGTNVVLEVLALSASAAAETEWEKRFASWIAAHDQSYFGSGMVGFDIDSMAWEPAAFVAQKAFVLRIIDLAIQGHNWHLLPYTPGKETLLPKLTEFRALVTAYEAEFLDTNRALESAYSELVQTGEKCPTHQIYLHRAGCIIDNNEHPSGVMTAE